MCVGYEVVWMCRVFRVCSRRNVYYTLCRVYRVCRLCRVCSRRDVYGM